MSTVALIHPKATFAHSYGVLRADGSEGRLHLRPSCAVRDGGTAVVQPAWLLVALVTAHNAEPNLKIADKYLCWSCAVREVKKEKKS